MNIALWTCQIFLMLLFLYSGIMKATVDPARLIRMGQTGIAELTRGTVRFIGISELLGAIGIVAPWETQIAPVLTPVAAVGFAIIMVLAARFHSRRLEFKAVGFNMFVLAVSLFVAYGRFVRT